MTSATERSGSTFWHQAAASIVLCVVAAVQVVRVQWFDQSPWKGGGFGMFASMDAPDARFAQAYLLTADGEVPAVLPRLDETFAARTAPTADNLDELAAHLATCTWMRAPNGAWAIWLGEGNAKPESAVPYQAVRVESWRSELDPATNSLRARKYRETTRARAGT